MRLEGKVAFITGAGRGIGRSIGLALARDGANIAVTGRTKERRDQVANEIVAAGGDARAFVLDVTKDEEVVVAVRQVLETWGQIDILVTAQLDQTAAHGQRDALGGDRLPLTGPQRRGKRHRVG